MSDSATSTESGGDGHGPFRCPDADAGLWARGPTSGLTAKVVAFIELVLTLVFLPVAAAGIVGLAACGLGLAEPSVFFRVWLLLSVCAAPLAGALHHRLAPLFQLC